MRPFAFDWRELPALGAGVLVLGMVAGACTELNPDYDPDAGPVCQAGGRRCATAVDAVEVCAEGGNAWVAERDCWAGTTCSAGACFPDAPLERCTHVADCEVGVEVCSVAADPDLAGHLGTFCLPPAVAGGHFGGQACAAHGECLSGWCFRRICYEACAEAATCTNTHHECALLDVTVDGVRDDTAIRGCVPPASATP
jgi:hypothetical protein